ncbi:MAG: hypothetical protein ACT4OT_07735 [Acidobacteriota bacterium]
MAFRGIAATLIKNSELQRLTTSVFAKPLVKKTCNPEERVIFAKRAEPVRSQRHVRWLLGAGALMHLLSTTVVYAVGRYGILPNIISPSGVLRGDSMAYLERSIALGRNFSELSGGNEQIHVRLYAVSTSVVTPVIGANIFSIGLISLPMYLLGLLLVYDIGRVCFEPRTGFAAAITVGLLPSFLLHETQPLRDPLFVVLMLALLSIILRLITNSMTAIPALACAASGCLILLLMWLVRDSFWLVYVGVVTLGLIALIAASIKERRAFIPNFMCLLFFFAALIFIPKAFSSWLPPKEPMTTEQKQSLEEFTNRQVQSGQVGVFLKISVMRQKFVILYKDAGSNIDADRTFPSATSVITYLPRAVLIGLFAPFPVSWFEEGKMYGLIGRLFAGLEICFVCLLTPFALAGVWRSRSTIQAWLLLAVALLGGAALGLVVVNVGALYRMRYFFWILIIILAASYLPRSLSLRRGIGFTFFSKKQSA